MPLKASSLLESVIAIAIISICIVIATSVYTKLFDADYDLGYYKGLQHIEKMKVDTQDQQNFDDDNVQKDGYSINKTVIELENNIYEIEYHLKTNNKEKKIYHLIQKELSE